MSDDRLTQARAEAERAASAAGINHRSRLVSAAFRNGVEQGVRWADAHPQPRTITKDEFETLCLTAADQIPPGARRAEVLAYTATYALHAAGIEVTDDE